MKLIHGSNVIKLDENSEVKFSALEIERAGTRIKVALVGLGSEEGLVINQAAELFEVSVSTILKHITRHAITYGLLVRKSLQVVKNTGLVSPNTARAVFIPRSGLRDLVRVIGTDSARSAFHQVFDDAEELLRIKPENELLKQKVGDQAARLLETAGQLKAALDLSAIDRAKLRMQSEQIAHLEAKLEAASHHISLGGNRKAPKFNLPIYVRQPDDIFKKPSYTIDLVKKSMDEMNDLEHKRFALQHSSKVAVGVSGTLIRTMNELGVNNPMIRDKADLLQAAAKDLHSEIMPSEAGLLALNSGYMSEGRHTSSACS